MDIIKTLGNSRKYTLHSHTEFCDGRATMEAFAREAVRQGFKHYGFSPHSPIPLVSPCNMREDSLQQYFIEYEKINEKYGFEVNFYKSMEIDYLGKHWNAANDYFQKLNLDYTISSVHFIPNKNGVYVDIDGHFDSFTRKMNAFFNDDIRYVIEKYYEQSIKMIEDGGFDIIGHFDKIGHNADHFQKDIEKESWYLSLVKELIDRIIDAKLIVEINTKAFRDHRRFFPSEQFWKTLLDANVPIIINSDAHVPALIDASRDIAFELLDNIKN